MTFSITPKRKKTFRQETTCLKLGENMVSTKTAINALLELGLSMYESRVYLTLVVEGISTAKNVSDITSIPYGKVYEIVNSLQSKGLLTILPTKPMKCQAINPSEALNLMRKQHSEKFSKLEQYFSSELEPTFAKSKHFSEGQSVCQVFHGRSHVNRKVKEIFSQAKKRICISTTSNGLKRLIIHKEALKAAKQRGVTIHINSPITRDEHEDARSLSFCDLRHIGQVPSEMITSDGKSLLLIEAVPDDEDIMYGRDICVHVSSRAFSHSLESLFLTQFKRLKTFEPNKS